MINDAGAQSDPPKLEPGWRVTENRVTTLLLIYAFITSLVMGVSSLSTDVPFVQELKCKIIGTIKNHLLLPPTKFRRKK